VPIWVASSTILQVVLLSDAIVDRKDKRNLRVGQTQWADKVGRPIGRYDEGI
jgi:hypothetical protein